MIMIRHIVSWNFNDGLTDEENRENEQKMKDGLERLKDIIDGIHELIVRIDLLDTSNRTVVMNSLFESEKHLVDYQVHPKHVAVSRFIGSVMKERTCVDYHE